MAGKPIGGPESAGASEQPGRQLPGAAGETAASTSYGPLTVLRMEKEDGRALIVYSRRGDSAER